MTELFLKEGSSILTFKKGDIITRLEAALIQREEYNDNLKVLEKKIISKSSSYIGTPFKYIGIFNNQIYVERQINRFTAISNIERLDLSNWSEGWALFELPQGITINDL